MQRDPWHNDFPLEPARVAEVSPPICRNSPMPRRRGARRRLGLHDVPRRRRVGVPISRSGASARGKLAREYKLLEALAAPLAQQIDRDSALSLPRARTGRLRRCAYVGYPFLRGEPLVDCPGGFDRQRRASAANSVSSCGRLHATAPTPRPRDLPRQFPSDLIDFRRELDEVERGASAGNRGRVRRGCSRARRAIDHEPPRFQHGDLGVEHILVDRRRSVIVAIIDWGDAGWGNPRR